MPEELPRVRAVTFHQEFSTGATHPCVFSCEDSAGRDAGEFVTKLRSSVRGNATGLAFECAAYQLGTMLGIDVPPASLVEIGADLAATIMDPRTRGRVQSSVGLNFGSRFMPTAIGATTAIPPGFIQAAGDIFLFDALMENVDRRPEKPNALLVDERIYAIDHELSFSFVFAIGAAAGDMSFLRNHVFYTGLKTGAPFVRERFIQALGSVTDNQLSQLRTTIPPDFDGAHMARIVEHVGHTRNAVALFDAATKDIFR